MENAETARGEAVPEAGRDVLEEAARRAGEVLGRHVDVSSLSGPSRRTRVFGLLLDAAEGEGPASRAARELARDAMRSFGPGEGVWAFEGPSGDLLGVADIHLCLDDESPSGLAWDYRVALVDGDGWVQVDDGGVFWGYASARDVAELAVPGDYFPPGTRCAGVVPGIPDLEGALTRTPARVSRAPSDDRPDSQEAFERSLAAAHGAGSPSSRPLRPRGL